MRMGGMTSSVRKHAIGRPLAHDSAHLHVTGAAAYTDDLPEPRDLLHVAVGTSEVAHARIRSIDLADVRLAEGVVEVYLASDIPGANNCGTIVRDEPILAADRVEYAGQAIFAVVAQTVDQARSAARRAQIEYDELPSILDPIAALEQQSFVLPSERLDRGDASSSIERAPHRIERRLRIGGQDHFYLEGQVAMAIPREDGDLLVYSSTQHPDQIQHLVAQAIGCAAKDVVCICRRMGGAFGGKESQAASIACIAALLAQRTGRPCKLRLDRDVDMILTGKRHDFVVDYRAGFDDMGRLRGVEFEFASRCGISADLSGPVNDRTMFHCDNAYYLEHVSIVSHRCKTHTVSNTAFRGFGGPQGMLAIECAIDDVARTLGIDPVDVRRANFYGAGRRDETPPRDVTPGRDITPYGQKVEGNILPELFDRLEADSDYRLRRRQIRDFNQSSRILKRGIAMTPVKFGISFTATHLNQAGALLHVYKDGSVQLNHGGTEMGQGLFIKVVQVVADELGIEIEQIRTHASDTSKVPNASATAASSGSDLNGKAAQAAARKIRRRLAEFAARHFSVSECEVEFALGRVRAARHELSFAELVALAWADRVSLSATGFYKTPKIHYDRATFSGRPFLYYAYGAAVSEALVDTLTGESRLLRVDILHDCGDSLNPAVDLGQIEGGFIQGVGWLTSEQLWWNERGQLQTHAPSTYKIPTCSDVPTDLRVSLLERAPNHEDTIYRSKAVGEPPLMLAISAFLAIRDAIASERNPLPRLEAPATPESILRAIGVGFS